jgi:hypothetical protein
MAFYQCSFGGELVIPGSVKTIEYGAFANSGGSNSSITISDGVETIIG